jgi:predicted aspartyl protease
MSGVTGSSVQKDRYRVRIQIGEIVVKGIDAVAVDDEDGSLIGRDVLSQLVVTLDGLAAETRVSNQ